MDNVKPMKPGKPGQQPLAQRLAATTDLANVVADWQSRWHLSHDECERLIEAVCDILGYYAEDR